MNSVPDHVYRAFKAADFNNWQDLWWRCDGEYAPITVFILCNDLFYWACADNETVTPENISLLEKTYDEMKAIDARERESKVDKPIFAITWAAFLFCCRARGMRPQKPFYEFLPAPIRPLFDACGPERDE